MKTILLCRVSSKEQDETGYSLPAQEKLLTSYAENKSFKVKKAFYIIESASGKKQRLIFDNMMDYIKKENIMVIIIEKVDRLTRNFKDAVTIDEWLEGDEERQAHFVKNSLILHKNSRSQEKLNWGLQIILAKNYIDNLSEEVKKGQKEKVLQGWLPTKPPIGYKTIGEKGHKIHVFDEAKAEIVTSMFEAYATGQYSLKKLTEIMQEKGLVNDHSKPIVKSRLHRYLTDPFYCGKIRWDNKIYEGSQEALISEELFNKVQGILRGKTTPKIRKHNFTFQSLIKCKECGCSVTWETHKKNIYGRCNHYKPCTQKKYSLEGDVEKQLMEGFEGLKIKSPELQEWIREALKESHSHESESRVYAVEELNSKIKVIDNRMDEAYIDKLDNKILQDQYDRILARSVEEKDDIRRLLNNISKNQLKYYQFGINFYEIGLRGKEIYERTLPENKKEFIKMVFGKLTLLNNKLEYEYSRPYKILKEAIEITNRSEQELMSKKTEITSELVNKGNMVVQSGYLYAERSNLLPREDSNLEP